MRSSRALKIEIRCASDATLFFRRGAVGLCAALTSAFPAAAESLSRICYPGFTIPAVTLRAVTIPAVTIPAVTIPAVTIPKTCYGGVCYPAQHIPAQHLPAQHIPAQHIPAYHVPRSCFTVAAVFAPQRTSVRVRNYRAIDRRFSPEVSGRYWADAGRAVSYPDPFANGFGGFNAAGFPKNQYVRPYFRRDGMFVHGYWRNSPTDGLPTCRIIRC
jgi:hypothetical protein